MFKSILVALSLMIISQPVQALTLEEFNKELHRFSEKTFNEVNRLGTMLGELSDDDIEKLMNTRVGDESLSQAELLIMSSDHVFAGVAGFEFYLGHSKSQFISPRGEVTLFESQSKPGH